MTFEERAKVIKDCAAHFRNEDRERHVLLTVALAAAGGGEGMESLADVVAKWRLERIKAHKERLKALEEQAAQG